MGSMANKTMIALVHSHVNSSSVRRQLLKLDSFCHIKVDTWKQIQILRPRRGNLLHPMFSLTRKLLLEEK